MRGLLGIAGVLLVVLAATWTYQVHYKTKETLNRVAQLQQQIAFEREALSVLRAEWAYLNRPARLAALVEANFGYMPLMPIHAEHFAEPVWVAYPLPEPEPEADPFAWPSDAEMQELDSLIEGVVDAAARGTNQPTTQATAGATAGGQP